MVRLFMFATVLLFLVSCDALTPSFARDFNNPNDPQTGTHSSGTTTTATTTSTATTPTSSLTRPTILSTVPVDGASDVPLSGKIDVVFSDKIAKEVTSSSIQVTSNGVIISGSLSLSADGITLEWLPANPIVAGATVHVVVKGSIASVAGSSLGQDFSFSFVSASLPLNGPIFKLGFESSMVETVNGIVPSIVGTESYAVDRKGTGKAFSFDGTTYLTYPETVNLDGFDHMTVCFWTKASSTGPYQGGGFLNKGNYYLNTGSRGSWLLYYVYGQLTYQDRLSILSGNLAYGGYDYQTHLGSIDASLFPKDTWDFVAYVFAKNYSPAVYINGVQALAPKIDNYNAGLLDTTDFLRVGCMIDNNGQNFLPLIGLLDDVEIYNTSLTEGQLSAVQFK